MGRDCRFDISDSGEIGCDMLRGGGGAAEGDVPGPYSIRWPRGRALWCCHSCPLDPIQAFGKQKLATPKILLTTRSGMASLCV